MIELKNIKKEYNHIVLDNVNLKLETGNIYLLKGISGSGKTTLFNILSGLDSNYAGDYLWDGTVVKEMTIDQQVEVVNQISYVFQQSLLFRKLTVKENLLFIKNDINSITNYAKEFNVLSLLEKYPEELSGGEKQRIALIRALLLDCKLLLFDEPTASLDPVNSSIFVKFLDKIDIQNKIIIIATHKNIYDDIANVVLKIDYGKITEVKIKKNEKAMKNKANKENKVKFNTLKYDIFFAYKRKKKRMILMLISILLFLVIFFSVSIVKNFKKEYIKNQFQQYSLQVINVSRNKKELLSNEILKTYNNYIIETEEYNAYILLDEEDSIFTREDILIFGNFPSKDTEVLVNEEYVKSVFPNLNFNDAIGKEVEIKNNIFTIAGIIHRGEYDGYLVYQNNPYYKKIDKLYKDYITPAVFVPYEKMKQIGTIVDSDEIVVTISKETALNFYMNSNNISMNITLPWDSQLTSNYNSIQEYVKILLGILLLVFIFIFIFVGYKITLDLLYKKREFGYLQLFRVSKKRILFICLIDYLLEIMLSFVIAIICYHVICLIIYLKWNYIFLLPMLIWFIITFAVFIYFYFLIKIPVYKYLKQDIISLIK